MGDRSIAKATSRHQVTLALVGVLAGLLQPLGVAAASSDDSFLEATATAVNLLKNGDFANDQSFWHSDIGTWQHNSSGFTGDVFAVTATGGSLVANVASFNEFNKYALVSQCVQQGATGAAGINLDAFVAVTGTTSFATIGGGVDAEVILQTFTTSDCTGPASLERRGAVNAAPVYEEQKWRRIEMSLTGAELAGRNSVKVFLSVVDRFVYSNASARFDRVALWNPNTGSSPFNYVCLPGLRQHFIPWDDDRKLCLSSGRFKVNAAYKTADGKSGEAYAVQLTSDSGYYTFFSRSNIEVMVKVLNACGLNNRYWVFASGGTDVEVTITVTDTQTGAIKTYKNPQGQVFKTITDVNAFATCP